MNYQYLLNLILFSCVFQVNAMTIEQNNLKSNILQQEVSYSIYLPPSYNSDNSTYPVIYLLHGYGDDHTTWIHKGCIGQYADRAIKEGKIPPIIIVMPNAGTSMYVNSYNDKNRYEDFFIKEFIPSIENRYRIKKEKESRGITGHSMGGWGCMLYSLKYPDLFVASAPLSPGIHDDNDIITYDDKQWNIVFGDIFGFNLKGNERLTEDWYKNSILKIIETKSKMELSTVHYRISCGDQDFLLKGSLLLHQALSDKDVQHELSIKGGGHTWNYWRENITETLEFISRYFW